MDAPFPPARLTPEEIHHPDADAIRANVPRPLRIKGPLKGFSRVGLYALVALGLASMIHFALWWFSPGQVNQPLIFALLSFAMWYGMSRMLVVWYGYLNISIPDHVTPPQGLSVAVFTTSSPGEPLDMFRRTLDALRRVSYPHTTYLLDDTRDPEFGKLAHELGAVHMEILDEPGAKAGKINVALQRTNEEFVLVLDPDHIPHPDLFHRVLGHFQNEHVGFVQVCQGYYNQTRSFTARAAAEQTFGFYGPIQAGMNGVGAAVAIGANCTFRRSALESIGGHGIGLAEDLITSIRLHARGWKSVYVPEVLTRGLVPEDLGSFCKQQFKWARGIYEVLIKEYPRAFRGLTWRQRLSYLAISTYYLVGLTTLIYFTLPLLYLATGLQGAAMDFLLFLEHGGPVGLAGVSLYLFTQRWMCDPRREKGIHWRAMLLKVGLWHVYLRALIYSLLGLQVPYIPTPKEAARGRFFRLAAIPLCVWIITGMVVAWNLLQRFTSYSMIRVVFSSEAVWAMILFASINVFYTSGVIIAAWQARSLPATNETCGRQPSATEQEMLLELGEFSNPENGVPSRPYSRPTIDRIPGLPLGTAEVSEGRGAGQDRLSRSNE